MKSWREEGIIRVIPLLLDRMGRILLILRMLMRMHPRIIGTVVRLATRVGTSRFIPHPRPTLLRLSPLVPPPPAHPQVVIPPAVLLPPGGP